LPFALVELDSLQTRQRQWQYHVPTPPAPKVAGQLKNAIEREIFPALQRLEWCPPEPADRERVAHCFLQMVDTRQIEQRVRTHMTRMIAASEPQALVGVRS
jgi:hypothetical protein